MSNAANIGSGCFVGINQPSPAYSLDIKNVSGHCGIALADTTGTPATPPAGVNVFYFQAGIPKFLTSTGIVHGITYT